MMVEIPDVLTPDETRQFRETLERAQWRDGRETAGETAANAKSNRQLAQDDPLVDRLGNFILERLGRVDRFMAAALPLKVMPPRFNRYGDGDTYGDHIDSAILAIPGTPHRIRGDLSATLFLSDPGDYDGGELTVAGDSGERAVKLPAGHMILYPASTVHRVAPVSRGVRFAAFFWVQSLVRENDRRALLLELDDSIRALRQDLPSHPSLVRLIGLYHNLLRQWANT